MDETTMYAIYGRKQVELDNLTEQYDRLLTLLSGVVSGTIDPKLVTVDLAERRWVVVAVAADPTAPDGEAKPGPTVN